MAISLPPIGALQSRGFAAEPTKARGQVLAAGAPRAPHSDGRGLAALGQGLASIGDTIKQSRQQENRKAAVERLLGVGAGARNDAMAQNGGPTNAAAGAMQQNPMDLMGIPPQAQQLLRGLYESGDYDSAFNVMGKFALAPPSERKVIQGADGYSYYQDNGERVLPGVQKETKPPETREVKRNGRIVTEQWNPLTGGFDEIGSSSQFAPRVADKPSYENLTNGDVTRRVMVGTPRYNELLEKGWYQGAASQPVAGRDVPLPEDVVGQKIDVARAGAGMNESQSQAAGFADRMLMADAEINKFGKSGADPLQRGLSNLPGGNYLVSPEFQMAEQAQRNFINAMLRRESGAAIAPSEFESAREQYFPQPGDGPEVISQKAKNRQVAIAATQRAAGPNYTSLVLPPLNGQSTGSAVPQAPGTASTATGGGVDVKTAPLDQIDVTKLTPEQRKELDARLKAEGF